MIKQKILTVAVVFGVLAAIAYGAYRRVPQLAAWVQGTGDSAHQEQAPSLPGEPKDADDNLKALYAGAIVKHDARLNDPNYIAYMAEGLEWKSVGDFAKTDRNTYYAYAGYIYTEAGKKFPEQWVPWYNVGNMFNLIGEYGRAEQAYKTAIEKDPTHNEAFTALVEMLTYRGVKPTDDILAYLTAAQARITVDQPFAAFTYARYLLENGKNQEALGVFELTFAKNPSDKRLSLEIEALKKVLKGESLEEPAQKPVPQVQ